MNFLKILGAALVACSGALLARSLNVGERRTLAQIEGILAFLRFVRTNIEAYSMPLSEILFRCPKNIYESCGYSREVPPSTVGELLGSLTVAGGFTAERLSEFAAEVGKGYRDEQLELLSRTLDALEERRQALSRALPSRTRVNVAVCLGVSLSAVILLF